MGISTDIFPVDTSDANASMDGRRKHKQPALTADFVNYYLGEELHIQLFCHIAEKYSKNTSIYPFIFRYSFPDVIIFRIN